MSTFYFVFDKARTRSIYLSDERANIMTEINPNLPDLKLESEPCAKE